MFVGNHWVRPRNPLFLQGIEPGAYLPDYSIPQRHSQTPVPINEVSHNVAPEMMGVEETDGAEKLEECMDIEADEDQKPVTQNTSRSGVAMQRERVIATEITVSTDAWPDARLLWVV